MLVITYAGSYGRDRGAFARLVAVTCVPHLDAIVAHSSFPTHFIPFSRFSSREIKNGVTLLDKDGKELGQSVRAAKEGISAVTFSRILMAMPGMGMV